MTILEYRTLIQQLRLKFKLGLYAVSFCKVESSNDTTFTAVLKLVRLYRGHSVLVKNIVIIITPHNFTYTYIHLYSYYCLLVVYYRPTTSADSECVPAKCQRRTGSTD